MGGTLNSGNLANYNQLVQACLTTDAACNIDIDNYARWDGQIIRQRRPTYNQFASLWSQLATKYASTKNLIFGLMNEPHDSKIIHDSLSSETSIVSVYFLSLTDCPTWTWKFVASY